MKSWVGIVLTFILLSFNFSTKAQSDDLKIKVTGNAIVEAKNFPGLNIYINMIEDGELIKSFWCDDERKFESEIRPNHNYLFEFTSDYHYTSKVTINTKNIPSEDLADVMRRPIDIDIEMFERSPDLDKSFMDKPLLQVKYLPSVKKMTYDYSHTEQVKKVVIYMRQENEARKAAGVNSGKVSEVTVLLNEMNKKDEEMKKMQSLAQSNSIANEELSAELLLLKQELEMKTKRLNECDSLDRNVFVQQLEEINDHGGLVTAREKLKVQYINARTKEDSMLIAMKEQELNMIEDELKAANADIISKELDLQGKELEVRTQKQRVIYAAIGIGAVGVLSIFLFISFRKTKKAKELISDQKVEIEERNVEINKSITYARRIQEAILPPNSMIKKFLPDSFVFYKPKDIVAGDFYWMEARNDEVYFAAADCTGHGVPGAMVSVVCSNALNRAVNEMIYSEPSDILNKTRELVVETFVKSEHDVNDGMDVAFCKFNPKTNKVWFSGAQNPLYRITNYDANVADEKTIHDGKRMLVEYKGDKQPIGKFSFARPFNQEEVQLEKGDFIYLFSDGFADQFGGDEGRKYMYKPFKKFLLSIHDKAVDEQKQILLNEFETWRGSEEQIDDICIIGVRV